MNATVENPDFYGYTSGRKCCHRRAARRPAGNRRCYTCQDPGKANVVYIPAYGSGNVSRHNFIQFVDRSDSTGQAENNNKSLQCGECKHLVQVTPDVEVQILLSSEGSDVIKGAGSGNLFIDVNYAWKSGDQRLAKRSHRAAMIFHLRSGHQEVHSQGRWHDTL